jgi:hypothetical protein
VHHILANLSYVGNSAVAVGERERTAIFSAALRRLFAREKNWSWSFALNFWFSYVCKIYYFPLNLMVISESNESKFWFKSFFK